MTDKAIILRAKRGFGLYVARIEFPPEKIEEITQRLKEAGFEVENHAIPNW